MKVAAKSATTFDEGATVSRVSPGRRLSAACTSMFAVAIVGPFAVLTDRAVQMLLLAAILIELPLRIDIYLLYSDSASSVGALYGINISVMTIAILALWSGWLVAYVSGHPAFRIDWRHIAPLGIYVLINAASIVVAADKQLWLYETTLVVQIWLVYVWLAHWISSRRELLFVLTTLLVGFVIECFIIVTNLQFSFAGIHSQVQAQNEVLRSAGTMPLDNTGSYIAMLLPVAASFYLAPLSRPYRVLGICAFAIGIGALVRTGVRGAWIAFGVSAIAMYLLSKSSRVSKQTVALLAAILICTVTLFSEQVIARVSGDDNGAASARIPLMRMAHRIIIDHPLLGVGANNFATAIPAATRTEEWSMHVWVVHNKYLLVWAETGIVGLITFVSPMFAALRQGARCRRRVEAVTGVLVSALMASLLGRFVMMLSQPFHNRSELVGLWCLLAIQLAVFRYTCADVRTIQGPRT